ncbi:MAG: PAS-domain containing protein [Rhodospirillaceae bacterium]
MTALILIFVLAVLLAAGPVWWLRRRLVRALTLAQREGERLAALLATAPSPGCGWAVGAVGEDPAFVAADFAPTLGMLRVRRPEEMAEALAESDAAAFRAAFDGLRRDGRGFRLEATVAALGRQLVVSGHRHRGFNVLWLEDASVAAAERARSGAALAGLAAAAGQRDILQALLDALPVPVWLRRDDLSLSWCNQAYAAALDSTPEAVVRVGTELGGGKALALRAHAAGEPRSETRRVVIGCDRHLIEVTEAPLALPDRGRSADAPVLVGFTVDCTREEAVRADLARHVSAHAAVLEQLGSAIAIYGADRRLSFYNQAYVRLWGLDESWLATLPTFSEVLEELRTRRRLPEYADFPQYKKENLALFVDLIEPREDLMHLPDGTTVRVLIVPHSFGGLMFVLEDVTNTLALESSYNILMAVQAETLDNLAEAVVVFGGDGRLKLHNPAYAAMWGLKPESLAGEPHITEVLEQVRGLMDRGPERGDVWAEVKDQMVSGTLERTARSGRLERTDGSVLDFAYVPLPDGAVLTTYLDVTDSVRVEQALRARNAALAEADRLKTEFLANVSCHLRTPLNSIMGFAEILSNQYFGPLNARQLEYARSVQSAGASLLAMINDILDLATIEAGYMVLERRPVAVAALLTGVASLAQEWTAKKSMRLELDCPEDIGEIDADEKRLKQALFTLISNAIRSSPPGGTITLSARRRRESVVLTVRDALAANRPGEGRSSSLERFEPPRPFGSRTSEEDTGLGLTLVKSFIELHGGEIGVESLSGQGTSIHCILPYGPAPDGAAEAVALEAP